MALGMKKNGLRPDALDGYVPNGNDCNDDDELSTLLHLTM